jgi:secreted trypsin-like serine protease
MTRFGLAAVLFVPATALAEPTSSPINPTIGTSATPVIGGTVVPSGKWPDAVAVLGAQGACTGTLIAPDVVLTAGHCAEINPTQVIANTTNYNAGGGTTAAVKSITAYPSWETSYDVSVVVLTAPITGITPRLLGTDCTFQSFTDGAQVHLVGFGLTDTAGQGDNTTLHEAMAPVTDADCSGGNGCMPGVAPGGEFIAGGSGTDSCFGDSGGPVYLDTPRGPIVIGAVSRGLDASPTPCGGGGIYVRTDKIAQWLETTSGKTIARDTCSGSQPPDGGDPNGGDPNDPSDPGNTSGPDEIVGGCSTTGHAATSPLFLLALAVAVALRQRPSGRTRRPKRSARSVS